MLASKLVRWPHLVDWKVVPAARISCATLSVTSFSADVSPVRSAGPPAVHLLHRGTCHTERWSRRGVEAEWQRLARGNLSPCALSKITLGSVRAASTTQNLTACEDGLQVSFVSDCEEATGHLAKRLAELADVGDVIFLHGEVGAGKSVFSRNFIRAVVKDEEMVVPSPTYLLQQIYDEHSGPPVHHFDLYRLTGPAVNMERLGLQNSFAEAISLVEWPDRLGEDVPLERLDVHIRMKEVESDRGYKSDVMRPAEFPRDATAATAEELVVDKERQRRKSASAAEERQFDYADERPREITLVPHGERWKALITEQYSRSH